MSYFSLICFPSYVFEAGSLPGCVAQKFLGWLPKEANGSSCVHGSLSSGIVDMSHVGAGDLNSRL